MNTKLPCGVTIEHGLNENGVLMVKLLNAGGSVTARYRNDKLETFPDEISLVISPSNFTILQELINLYATRKRHGRRKS